MQRIFRHPAANAAGISLFTLFYSVIFLGFSDRIMEQTGAAIDGFWKSWESFLQAGGHQFLALAMIALTMIILALLFDKHKPYDEYHTAMMLNCLAVSIVLALLAIAVFFVVVFIDPVAVMSKLMLFVCVNWTTVVLADLAYVLLCAVRGR